MPIGGGCWSALPPLVSAGTDRHRGLRRCRVCSWAKRKGTRFMFKSTFTSLILLGILAIIAGIIAIAWPGVTVLALVAAFGSDETPGSRAMLVIGGLLS